MNNKIVWGYIVQTKLPFAEEIQRLSGVKLVVIQKKGKEEVTARFYSRDKNMIDMIRAMFEGID